MDVSTSAGNCCCKEREPYFKRRRYCCIFVNHARQEVSQKRVREESEGPFLQAQIPAAQDTVTGTSRNWVPSADTVTGSRSIYFNIHYTISVYHSLLRRQKWVCNLIHPIRRHNAHHRRPTAHDEPKISCLPSQCVRIACIAQRLHRRIEHQVCELIKAFQNSFDCMHEREEGERWRVEGGERRA